jgi:RNA polymerase sigma-70 factor (ECF subfamily)
LDNPKVINIKSRTDSQLTTSPEIAEEQAIICRAQQGDQQAFYQLYQKYHRKVYAICWRMLADKDSAEDVCQEVFVQLWQKISNFRGDSKFSTWLHSVTSNIVLGHLRKHKNWLQRIFSIEDQTIQDVAVEMEDTIELTVLDTQIARLPERARLVFVLFAVEGYRHEEIAKMLDMAVGTSKAQYHRAKSRLREWVEI